MPSVRKTKRSDEPPISYASQQLIRGGAHKFGKMYETFMSFVIDCKLGKRMQLHGPDYVAVDRKQWDEIQRKLNGSQIVFDDAPDYPFGGEVDANTKGKARASSTAQPINKEKEPE